MQSATAPVPTPDSEPATQPMKANEMQPSVDEKKDSPSADGYVNGEMAPMQPMPPMPVNGGMPPQQVYVNTAMGYPGMAALENQFHSMGMSDMHSAGPPESSEGDGENYDGERPVKLFVGQVPKNLTEEDIFPTFDPFGPLKDVTIIRDKHNGMHRGCAFVTFWSRADSERAQEALHDKFKFSGARKAAQVKPAEPTVPENKLFIGMLSRTASEEDVRELFAPFGEIREIYMIRNADGTSKCAAFLRFMTRESAEKAIENLHNNIVMDGSARPLIVKFADNKAQRQQRHMRHIRRNELLAAMGAPGQPYPAYHQVPPHLAMPPHSGGPQYGIPPQYGGAYPGPNHTLHGHHAPPPHYMYPHQYAPTPPYGYQDRPDSRPQNPRPREGPAGANLFVYHLPHDLTDADLATAFNPFGNVISAKVYVDKYTGESKGFGFVSYDSVMSAETAIEQMNGFQIGNKRLKVQHKRVHSQNAAPQQQQQHQPQEVEPHYNAGPPPQNIQPIPMVNP